MSDITPRAAGVSRKPKERWWSPGVVVGHCSREMSLKPTVSIDIDIQGRPAYIRTTRTEFHLQMEPILINATPSRYKSPDKPERNEWGVTWSINSRASRSSIGKALPATIAVALHVISWHLAPERIHASLPLASARRKATATTSLPGTSQAIRSPFGA